MRYLSIIMVLVFFTTLLNASHFRSIRVGSFLNKVDADKSLIKLNKYMKTQRNIIHFQKKLFFRAKAIKVGRYYMNVIEPFGDNQKELQEIVDTIRKKYPHAYIKKVKGKMPKVKHSKPVSKPKIKEVIKKEPKKIIQPIVEKVAEPIVITPVVIPKPIIEKKIVPVVIEEIVEPIIIQEKNETLPVVIQEKNETIIEENISEPIIIQEKNETIIEENISEPIIEETLVEEIVISDLQDVKVIEKENKESEIAVVEVEEQQEKEVEVAVVEIEEQQEKEIEVAVVEVKEEQEKEVEVAVVEVKENKILHILNTVPKEIKFLLIALISFIFFLFVILLVLLKKVSNLKKEKIFSIDSIEIEQIEQTEKLSALEKQLELINITHENSMMQLNSKHKEEISTLEDSYNRKIGTINLNNENSLSELLLNHQNDMDELIVSNKDKIQKIEDENLKQIEVLRVELSTSKTKEIQTEPLLETPTPIQELKEPEVVPVTIEEAETEELTSAIGLGNCDGDEQFYNTILAEFKTSYKESPLTFETLCIENNFEDARHLAGDIKDLAVNIGAYNLCESVASMEYDFEKGSTTNWKKLVENYKEKLEKLIIEIDDYTNKN